MNSKNIVAAIVIGAIFIFLGLFIGSRMKTENSDNSSSPSVTAPTVTPEVKSEGAGNIIVNSPGPNESVGKNFLIAGKARVFENTFHVRIKHNTSGETIFDQKATSNAPDAGQYGNFAVAVTLPDKTPKKVVIMPGDKITVEVFQFSAKDGSEIDKATIPVTY